MVLFDWNFLLLSLSLSFFFYFIFACFFLLIGKEGLKKGNKNVSESDEWHLMSCMGKLGSSKNKGTELGSHVLRSKCNGIKARCSLKVHVPGV